LLGVAGGQADMMGQMEALEEDYLGIIHMELLDILHIEEAVEELLKQVVGKLVLKEREVIKNMRVLMALSYMELMAYIWVLCTTETLIQLVELEVVGMEEGSGGSSGSWGGAPGGGGSSYVGGVLNGQTMAGNQSILSPSNSSEIGNFGDGYARITSLNTSPNVTVSSPTANQQFSPRNDNDAFRSYQ